MQQFNTKQMQLNIAQLYDTEFDSVYGYVHFRVRHTQEAEEIVSAIFMKVVEHADKYTPQKGASPRSWLFAIVRNTLADYYKKKRINIVDLDAGDEASTQAHVVRNIDKTAAIQQVFAAVDSLPTRQQEVMLLRYKSDLKNKEIAQVLGITEKSVSAALSKATNTLRTNCNLERI